VLLGRVRRGWAWAVGLRVWQRPEKLVVVVRPSPVKYSVKMGKNGKKIRYLFWGGASRSNLGVRRTESKEDC